jgi:hypothetical protein
MKKAQAIPTPKKPKKGVVSFRIRRLYYDQIVAGTKNVELRKARLFFADLAREPLETPLK